MATELHAKDTTIWHRVRSSLLQHAIPDSRFHYDFSLFVPDFRGSAAATDRIVKLPCYQSAKTLLVTPDNCLEQLRHRALLDGKKLLVATYKLRRGFVLLDPKRIDESRFDVASSLDGMERPGIGKHVSLAQIEDKIDLCVTGVLAISAEGVTIQPSPQYFEIQWNIFSDRKLLDSRAPVAALAHCCQVVGGDEMPTNTAVDGQPMLPDFIMTPETAIQIHGAERPAVKFNVRDLDPKLVAQIPALQELQGIQMMDHIMATSGFVQEDAKSTPKVPSEEEQLGMSIVDRLMKGYKV